MRREIRVVRFGPGGKQHVWGISALMTAMSMVFKGVFDGIVCMARHNTLALAAERGLEPWDGFMTSEIAERNRRWVYFAAVIEV